MSGELEVLLREGMEHSTASLRVPPGLVRRAFLRHRRRRITMRAAAAGTAAAVTAAGVTAVSLSGGTGPGRPTGPAPGATSASHDAAHIVTPAPAAPPRLNGCGPAGQGRTGWPVILRQELGCGRFRVAGHATVNGVSTIKIIEVRHAPGPVLIFWVDQSTYLPVRIVMTDGQAVINEDDTSWLRPTPGNLAKVSAPHIPAGFTRVPAGHG